MSQMHCFKEEGWVHFKGMDVLFSNNLACGSHAYHPAAVGTTAHSVSANASTALPSASDISMAPSASHVSSSISGVPPGISGVPPSISGVPPGISDNMSSTPGVPGISVGCYGCPTLFFLHFPFWTSPFSEQPCCCTTHVSLLSVLAVPTCVCLYVPVFGCTCGSQ